MENHTSLPVLDTLVKRLQATLPDLKKQYNIREIGVFGSYVRGEQTAQSDLDVLVAFDPDYRLGLLTFCELENKLTDYLGVKVDLVMKSGLKPRIGERILAEVCYL